MSTCMPIRPPDMHVCMPIRIGRDYTCRIKKMYIYGHKRVIPYMNDIRDICIEQALGVIIHP